MTETTDTTHDDTAPTLDATALGRWMDAEKLPGDGTPTLTQTLRRFAERAVRRRARRHQGGAPHPAHRGEARFDGLRRESRLLRALKGADVPHAEFVAGADDATIIGAPFYLMQPVDGWSPMGHGQWPEPFESDPAQRRGLAFELVRGAALLSKVDWRARGLEGFGRPENFHDRQVDRWLNFLAKYQFRDLPGLDEASGWLRAHRPAHWEPGIMHGDYQFANVMYAHGAPARLAAVIDWEMTTIGDPLLDLGWVLISWPPEGDDMTRYVNLDGMPTRDELLEHYEEISGRSTEDIDYYVVLARWKLGIVLEMSYAKLSRRRGRPQGRRVRHPGRRADPQGGRAVPDGQRRRRRPDTDGLRGRDLRPDRQGRGRHRRQPRPRQGDRHRGRPAGRGRGDRQPEAGELRAGRGRDQRGDRPPGDALRACTSAAGTSSSRSSTRSTTGSGAVDVLFNNAGMSPVYDKLTDVTEKLFDSVINLNFKGPFRLAALIGERMAAAGGGSIINVSSSGSIRPTGRIIPYAGAKAALNAMSEGLAEGLGPQVRVNTLMPGTFQTDVAKAWDFDAVTEDTQAAHRASSGRRPAAPRS